VTAAVTETGAEREPGSEPSTGKPPRDGRSASSSFQVLAAEALVVPTGILVAALVTRTLGASGYGLFTLALAIVLATENVLGSFFGRATVKLVSEASDPRPAAAAASRLYFALGLVAMLLLWAAAEPLARLFEAPRFAVLLRIAALDLPAAALARSLRDTLIGLGRFDRRARAAAVRWSSRLVLIAVALLAGLGVEGALAACVVATLLEALASRTGLGLLTASTAGFPLSRLLAYSLPLFVYGLGVSFFARLDLFALKSLGFDAAAVGLYAAAANAAGSFQFGAVVLSPLLLSTLSRRLADGRLREARALVRDALRFALLAIPFAAIAAGAAPELLRLVYGAGFEPAAPVMRLLMVAAAAHVVTGVAVGAIVAAGHTWRIAALGALPPLVALAGYLLAIPRFGPLGAAAVSTAVAVATAAATLALVAAAWRVLPPAATALRAVLVAMPLVAIALLWQPSALGTLLEVAVLGGAAALLLAAAGELDGIELQRVAAGVRRLLRRPASAPAWDRVPAALDRRGHYLDRFLGRLKRREVLALVARWRAGGAGWVLKTDLFEEAMGPDALLPRPRRQRPATARHGRLAGDRRPRPAARARGPGRARAARARSGRPGRGRRRLRACESIAALLRRRPNAARGVARTRRRPRYACVLAPCERRPGAGSRRPAIDSQALPLPGRRRPAPAVRARLAARGRLAVVARPLRRSPRPRAQPGRAAPGAGAGRAAGDHPRQPRQRDRPAPPPGRRRRAGRLLHRPFLHRPRAGRRAAAGGLPGARPGRPAAQPATRRQRRRGGGAAARPAGPVALGAPPPARRAAAGGDPLALPHRQLRRRPGGARRRRSARRRGSAQRRSRMSPHRRRRSSSRASSQSTIRL
jgi:O-antigen/teichoic acid export membrane protein